MTTSHISLSQACTQFLTAFKLGQHKVNTPVESDKYYSVVSNKCDSVAAEDEYKELADRVYSTCESRGRIHPRVNKMLGHTGIRVYKKCNQFIVEYPYVIGDDVANPGCVTHRVRLNTYTASDTAVQFAINLAVMRGYQLVNFETKEIFPIIKDIAQVLRDYKFDIPDNNESDDHLEVTIGFNGRDTKFASQSGDTQYYGSVYQYSGRVSVDLYKDSNCYQLARRLRRDMENSLGE